MRIDQDYLRSLLQVFGDAPNPNVSLSYLFAHGSDIDDPKFELHMGVLCDRRMIEQTDGDPGFGFMRGMDGHLSWSDVDMRLTATGHEFLDTVRDSEVWRLTKEGAAKMGGVGLELLISLATAYGKQVMSKRLGIHLGD